MKTVPNIILASKSARRKEIFEHLGLRPTVLVSGADENIPETDPRLFVEEAAKRKIDAVKHLCSKSDLIIASDTIVFYNGKILGKPNGKSQAIEMLSLLSGTTHKVISGIIATYLSNLFLLKAPSLGLENGQAKIFKIEIENPEALPLKLTSKYNFGRLLNTYSYEPTLNTFEK